MFKAQRCLTNSTIIYLINCIPQVELVTTFSAFLLNGRLCDFFIKIISALYLALLLAIFCTITSVVKSATNQFKLRLILSSLF
jgi:hypothetical protein